MRINFFFFAISIFSPRTGKFSMLFSPAASYGRIFFFLSSLPNVIVTKIVILFYYYHFERFPARNLCRTHGAFACRPPDGFVFYYYYFTRGTGPVKRNLSHYHVARARTPPPSCLSLDASVLPVQSVIVGQRCWFYFRRKTQKAFIHPRTIAKWGRRNEFCFVSFPPPRKRKRNSCRGVFFFLLLSSPARRCEIYYRIRRDEWC